MLKALIMKKRKIIMKVRLTWIIFVKIRATIKLLKKHFEQKSKKHTFLRKNRIFKCFFMIFLFKSQIFIKINFKH